MSDNKNDLIELSPLAIAGLKPYEVQPGEEYMNDKQKAHFRKILSNCFTLSMLFRLESGISSRSINKGDDWSVEFLRFLHQTKSFSITFRTRHTEVALDIFLYGLAFSMADNRNR